MARVKDFNGIHSVCPLETANFQNILPPMAIHVSYPIDMADD